MKTDTCKIKRQRGSLTVEAALSMLIFTVAMASLLLMLSELGYKERVHQELYETVQQMSMVDLQSNAECYGLAMALTVLKHPDDTKGLHVSSAVLKEDGNFNVKLSWRTRLPIGSSYTQNYALSGRIITRGFDGISSAKEIEVYVTKTGNKYHLKDCNHLRLSCQPMKRSEAIENGYEPCWHCVGGLKPFEEAPGKLGD